MLEMSPHNLPRTLMILPFALLGTLLSGQSGCEGGSDPYGHSEEHACIHMEDGPAEPVVATASLTSAPSLAEPHTRYDVALDQVSDTAPAYVSFSASDAADYLIMLSAVEPVRVLDETGELVPFLESRESSVYCEAIQSRHVATLEAGQYYLELGPTSATSLSVVLEEG